MLAILAATLLAAAPMHDTVFTSDGGRVVGTVVEEGPQGIAVQLGDGTFRRLPRREVVRIEYADGSVSKPAEAAPAQPQPPPPAQQPAYPPPQAYPPPPQYTPPPPQYTPPPPPAYLPPPYRVAPPPPRPAYVAPPRGGGPLSPLYLSFGLGGAFLSGEAERDVDVDRVAGNQFALALEGGVRLNPHLALGLYLDGGAGDVGSDFRSDCSASGLDCTASTGRFGVLLRATLEPAAPSTPWLSVGTGMESTTVSFNDGGPDLTYSGWDMLRLQGGWDFRGHGVVGVGLYAGVRFGRYSQVEGVDPVLLEVRTVHLGADRAIHTTVEAGLRFTLFP